MIFTQEEPMNRISRKSLPVVLAKKLMLRLVVLVALLSGTVAVVHAEIYYIQGGGGYTWWLSCGSSAGNYYYRCYNNGSTNVCEACDTGPCQEGADQQCANRGHAPIQPVDGPVQ